MQQYKIYTRSKKILADTATPVSIYLRLRDVYANTIMLESSDYHSRENSRSIICALPLAGIVLKDGVLRSYFNSGEEVTEPCTNLSAQLENFKQRFNTDACDEAAAPGYGLYGYFSWNAIPFMEDIIFRKREDAPGVPEMQYHFYKYVIMVDHFKNDLTIYEHSLGAEEESTLDEVLHIVANKGFAQFDFTTAGEEEADISGEAYKALVMKMQEHIKRGDVFQIVPSRQFSLPFKGDEFNVYRCLRSINPSPYLFYFDYGDFKIFGSSPEAQIKIAKGVAEMHPIAGTYKRTGNDREDQQRALELQEDEKETAEHVMLVDLCRNDLSRCCTEVKVEAYKQVQFYSHLIHLVSKVTGRLKAGVRTFDVVRDTFPAGTLSGAPKYKAMELLDRYEKSSRFFYAGAVGYMGLRDGFNHAIIIRSFLSTGNKLYWQAGAGVVAGSVPESELNEVNNKIAALRSAVVMAKGMGNNEAGTDNR